jgi:predicted transcriptional regulator
MKKITVILEDDELYTALRVQAAKSNRRIKEIVAEALEDWLQFQEDAEDAVFAEEAMAEAGENIPWEQVKREMRLRLKAARVYR